MRVCVWTGVRVRPHKRPTSRGPRAAAGARGRTPIPTGDAFASLAAALGRSFLSPSSLQLLCGATVPTSLIFNCEVLDREHIYRFTGYFGLVSLFLLHVYITPREKRVLASGFVCAKRCPQ